MTIDEQGFLRVAQEHARRIDAHGSLVVAKEGKFTLDTDPAGRRDAMNPVKLLLSALAA